MNNKKLCNLPPRAAQRLRRGVIGLLSLSGLMAMQSPALATVTSSPALLTPSDLRTHYNIPSQYTGKGQTIVILAADLSTTYKTTTARTALNAYSTAFSLPQCTTTNPCFDVVDVPTNIISPAEGSSDGTAATIDIEMAHGIAPGARIVLLSVPTTGTSQAAVNQKILDLKPTVVVIGKYVAEAPGQTSAETNCLCDGFFAAHPEIAFINGFDVRSFTPMYPATSPYVTSVGRTTWAPYYNYGVEIAGNQFSSGDPYLGSGFSTVETMPDYQKKYLTSISSSLMNESKAGQRFVPDVAIQASALVAVHLGTDSGLSANPGTAVAPAQWAGIVAVLGEATQNQWIIQGYPLQGYSLADLLRVLGGFNKLLYREDVAKTFNHFGTDAFHSKVGLGAPDVAKLITALSPPAPLVGSAVQGTTLSPLMSIRSLNGRYLLKMQLDGNLVLFSGDGDAIWNATWKSRTQSYPGAYAVMQKDGKLVVYDAKGQERFAMWSNPLYPGINALLSVDDDGHMRNYKPENTLWTVGTPLTSYADPAPAWRSSVWPIGTILQYDQFISSVNGENKLIMQSDGNLVLYHKGVATWKSGTYGNVHAYAKMQSDGNLVVYANDGRALWNSGTYDHPGASVVVQDDGTVGLYTWKSMW